MSMTLYDLAGRDEFRFSPFCWRSKMALHHKGLEFETVAVKFTDRTALAPSGQERLPVLQDGEKWVSDSWAIARHLDEAFPDRPPLLDGDAAVAHARFINNWADTVIHGGLIVLIVRDVLDHVHADDVDFFRETREARFGKSLDAVIEGRDEKVEKFRSSLQPLRQTLKDQNWLGGNEPSYADYIIFGSLQWGRCASPFRVLAEDDVINHWFGKMLQLFDGVGDKAPGYAL